MRLDFWHRKASPRELVAAEQRGFERYKAHTDLNGIRRQMAEVREQCNALELRIYELESLLSHSRPYVTDEALRDAIDDKIGPDPEATSLVATFGGGFERAR